MRIISKIVVFFLGCAVFSATAQDKTLKVLSLNTWMIPIKRKKGPKRFKLFPRYFQNYDFVGTQELFGKRRGRRLLRRMPDEFIEVSTRSRKFLKFNSGLANITRHDIVEHAFVPFKACRGANCLAVKGVLYTRLSIGGQVYIDVFNTHLEHQEIGREVRQKQIEQIKRLIKERRDPANPMIILGDLNILGDTDEYKDTLKTFGVVDVWRKVYPDAKTHPGYTWNPKRNKYAYHDGTGAPFKQRIDYILVDNGTIQCWKFGDNGTTAKVVFTEMVNTRPENRHAKPRHFVFLSDHFGVEANLKIGRCK